MTWKFPSPTSFFLYSFCFLVQILLKKPTDACKSFNGMQSKVIFKWCFRSFHLVRTGFYMQTDENVEDSWHLYLGMKFSVLYVRGPIYDSLITDHTGKYDNTRCLTSDQRYGLLWYRLFLMSQRYPILIIGCYYTVNTLLSYLL